MPVHDALVFVNSRDDGVAFDVAVDAVFVSSTSSSSSSLRAPPPRRRAVYVSPWTRLPAFVVAWW